MNAMGDELNDIVNINRSADKPEQRRQSADRHQNHLVRHPHHRHAADAVLIVSLVVLVLTLVGVGTTISSIVSQRRNEIGLRSPAPTRAIGVEFCVESGIYGLIGGLLGTAIAGVLARVLRFHRFRPCARPQLAALR